MAALPAAFAPAQQTLSCVGQSAAHRVEAALLDGVGLEWMANGKRVSRRRATIVSTDCVKPQASSNQTFHLQPSDEVA